MIGLVMFLLLLGLIVFGPKKTIEMVQVCGKAFSQVKQATGQFKSQIETRHERNGTLASVVTLGQRF